MRPVRLVRRDPEEYFRGNHVDGEDNERGAIGYALLIEEARQPRLANLLIVDSKFDVQTAEAEI